MQPPPGADAAEGGVHTLMVALINGQQRPVDAQDRSLDTEDKGGEKADPAQDGHVSTPMAGR